MDSTDAATLARRLGGALEPVIGQVFFASECHEAYEGLGFDGSSGEMDGVQLPDGPAYFTSRGSLMGQVSGGVIAAAFGVFNPDVVVPSVELGWQRTDADTIFAARDAGALALLHRILGPDIEGRERVSELLAQAAGVLGGEGRPLASGVRGRAPADDPFGAIFRNGEFLREHRGDSHTIAWVGAGLTAIDIGLLTEAFWGLPLRTYSRTRGWTDAQYDEAEDRLRSRGLMDAGGVSRAGRELRETIEQRTDQMMEPALDALGNSAEELIALLTPWGARIRAGAGYPQSGPHELAERAAKA